MAEKARPRIVAERHRLSFGHCHRDPHLNDPPFSRHGASELGVGGSHPCSRRFPNTSVELLAKSEEKPEKSPKLGYLLGDLIELSVKKFSRNPGCSVTSVQLPE